MPNAEEFYRIKRLPPYVFAEVNRLKAECRAGGMDIIDFGMGNPDMDTPAHIVEKLVETVKKPRTHRYSASRGIAGLRRAQAAYYQRRFGVALAQKYGVWVLSDLAYAEIYFDGNPPPSILQVEGAKDCAVEFTSLSKTYAMPGWRMGFAVGNARLVSALTRIKSYLDYGAFTPVQVAATAALNGPQDCIDEIRAIYRGRRDVLVQAMGRAGWRIPAPPATMFAWAPVPEPFARLGSMEFSKLLLTEAEVAVSPGIGFGEYGEGFVCIGLVEIAGHWNALNGAQ